MVPPDDDDHGCAWRAYAEHLEKKLSNDQARADARMQEMEAKLRVLERNFERRTEKMGKMPKIPSPPRTPEEIAERRTEQALLRTEKVVIDEKTVPVPDTMKKCHLCGGTNEPVRISV